MTGRVLALFGPDRSRQVGGWRPAPRPPRCRDRLGRLGRAVRGPAGPHRGAAVPGPARRHGSARPRRLGRGVPALGARRGRRDRRSGRPACDRRRHGALLSRRALEPRDPGTTRGDSSRLLAGALRPRRSRSRTRAAGGARSGSGGPRARERPQARRARARAGRERRRRWLRRRAPCGRQRHVIRRSS